MPDARIGARPCQQDKPIEGGESALWRKGSFEIMRLDNNDVLYSKIIVGDHLVAGPKACTTYHL